MTTLTETSSTIRSFAKRAGQVALLLLALFVLFRTGRAIFSLILPPSAQSPTVAFGQLPQVDLSEGVIVDNLNIKVDTISGDIPNLAASAKVFVLKNPDVTFGNLDEVVKIATKLGFLANFEDLGRGKVKFTDAKKPDRVLIVELASNNFRLESNFLGDVAILESKPRSLETVKTTAFGFLQNFVASRGEYLANSAGAAFYAVNNGKLEKALSLSSASVVQVIFNSEDIDKTNVFYINEADPLVWVMVSDKDVLAGEKAISQIQKFKFATYPLKGASVAYNQLKTGSAVFNKQPADNNFAIRNVKIVYVLTRKFQSYLQPVYIFEGDDNVNAYVSAISDAWTLKK